MLKKINFIKLLNIIIILLTIICMFSTNFNQDTLFHIKNGEMIIKKGFFTKDLFSMHSNLNYIAYSYLFEVISYLFYKLLNFKGIVLLKYIFISIFYLLSYKLIKYYNKDRTLSLIISLELILLCSNFFVVRPQIISYLFLIIQLFILEKYFNENSKLIYLLPITFLLLSNLHNGVIYFHLGICCIYFFKFLFDENLKIVNLFKNKDFYKYIIIIISCLLLSFINPYFPKTLTYSFNTLGNSYMMLIKEWHSSELFSIFGAFVLICAVLVIKLFNKKNIPIQILILNITMIIFSMKSNRFIPYLTISILLYFACYLKNKNIDFLNKFEFIYKLSIFLCLIIVLISFSIISIKKENFEFSDSKMPNKIVEYIKENNITNLYNEYNNGAYLLFNDIKVFIDQRCDLYSESFNDVTILKDDLDIEVNNYDPLDLFKKYNLEYALIDTNSNMYKIHIKKNKVNYTTIMSDKNFILLKINI